MKGREILGWTALIGALVAVMTVIVSLTYTPPSSMQGREGRKFVLYEHMFKSKEMKAENRAALEESISKVLVKKAQDKRDSIAKVEQAKKDSLAKFAKHKRLPTHNPRQSVEKTSQIVRMKH